MNRQTLARETLRRKPPASRAGGPLRHAQVEIENRKPPCPVLYPVHYCQRKSLTHRGKLASSSKHEIFVYVTTSSLRMSGICKRCVRSRLDWRARRMMDVSASCPPLAGISLAFLGPFYSIYSRKGGFQSCLNKKSRRSPHVPPSRPRIFNVASIIR